MAVIDNLIAYYPLDEASGSGIDAHTGGLNLAEVSGSIGAASGLVSGARDFEAGDSEALQLDNAAFALTGDFTIAGWVNAESLSTNTVAARWLATGNQRCYSLDYASSRFRFLVTTNGASGTAAIATGNTFGAASTGTWYFVAGWHDAVNDQLGVSVNAGTPDLVSHSAGVFNGTAPFNIGAVNSTAPSSGWDGLVDELGVWGKVLTPTELTWLYNSGAGRSYADIVAEAGGGAGPARRRRLIVA